MRVIVLVRVAVVMDLVEMNVQIGPLPKQLIDGGVADVRSVEIERLQFGDRLQIGQAAVGDGDVNQMDSPQPGEVLQCRDSLIRHLGAADAEHLELGEQFELSQPGVGEFALREIEDSQVGHRGKSLQAVVADAAAANAQMLELGEFGNLRHARVGEFVLGVVELQGPQARHIC